MSFPANEQRDEPVASMRRAADPRRARARFCWAGIVVVTLLGTAMLVAGCGGGSSGQGVAGLGKTTTTTAPSAAQGGSTANPFNRALAFADCMRSHGEPNFPDPVRQGAACTR